MKLYLSPQRNNNELKYVFEGETLTITYKTYDEEFTETFDLTDIHERDEEGEITIKEPEILPIHPISFVEEINGELYVRVLRFHGPNPPHDVAWPDWIEVEDGATYPNN